MKLSYEDKKEIVRLYFEEHMGYSRIAFRFGIHPSVPEMIVRAYDMHGEKSLKIKNTKRVFAPDLKMQIIEKVLNGESKRSVAVQYDIQGSMIISWIKRFEAQGYNGLVEKKKGRPGKYPMKKPQKKSSVEEEMTDDKKKIKELEERLHYLEMENDYLKKLDALVQERIKQGSKKE